MYIRSANSNIVVQVVKGQLRAVGHDDKFGSLMGWFYRNTTDAYNPFHSQHLFNQLDTIRKDDYDLFVTVMSKLRSNKNMNPGLPVWLFEREVNERESIATHEPKEIEMVIFTTDDNGRRDEFPVGTVTIMSTGSDKRNAAKAVEKFTSVDRGWHTAEELTDDLRGYLERQIAQMKHHISQIEAVL